MADLHHMAQIVPVELARQKLEEFAEICFVEFLGGRELPQHRAKAVAELQHAGIIESLDGISGLPKHAAVSSKARPLDREHKAIRYLTRPFAKALRLLRAVVGAVDLDRRQLRGRVLKFLRLREFLGVKYPAPGLERPATDAEIDPARFGLLGGLAHGLIGTVKRRRRVVKSFRIDQFARGFARCSQRVGSVFVNFPLAKLSCRSYVGSNGGVEA